MCLSLPGLDGVILFVAYVLQTQWNISTIHLQRITRPSCRCVLGQDPKLAPDSCTLRVWMMCDRKVLHIDELYEWVSVTCSVKPFKWMLRLEKCCINAAHSPWLALHEAQPAGQRFPLSSEVSQYLPHYFLQSWFTINTTDFGDPHIDISGFKWNGRYSILIWSSTRLVFHPSIHPSIPFILLHVEAQFAVAAVQVKESSCPSPIIIFQLLLEDPDMFPDQLVYSGPTLRLSGQLNVPECVLSWKAS